MVTTGDPIPEGSKSEVIDLSDPENVCESLPNYPLGMASGFGGLVDGNTPLLCSGYSPSQNENYVHDECFIFSEGELAWLQLWSLAPNKLGGVMLTDEF